MADSNSKPYGVVYALINMQNGKMYIGQTTRTLSIRWRQHCNLPGKCRAIEAAIVKYGAHSFYIDELATAATQLELDALEIKLILQFDTISPNGYNLREGGGATGKHGESTKKLLRERALAPSRMAVFNAMRIRPDVVEKQRAISKERWPQVAAKMTAAHKSVESRAKRSATLKTHYSTPGAKERLVEARAARCADPLVRANHSQGAKRQHAQMTEEQRAARGRKISETKQRLRRERLGV